MAAGLLGKFATVGGATLASRILGFVRDALIGRALGTSDAAEAYVAAFALPNLFRRIFAEGAFNTAFVPLFAKRLEGKGENAAQVFAQHVVSLLVPVLFVLSALLIFAMPLVMAGLNPFWVAGELPYPEKYTLSIVYGRIMFPYLFCMSLVAMLSGVLNALRQYFVAAIVPVLLNVILVAAVAAGIYFNLDKNDVGLALAWGVFIAGFAQLLLLVAATRSQGFRLLPGRPRLNADTRRLMVLMGPAVLTGGVLQINLVVGQIIASAQDGARALLYYADRLNQLPLGLIGIAVGVVLLPELSRALKAKDMEQAASLQNRSLEFALGLTLPAAVGFLVLPVALVSLVFEGGAFTRETSEQTAYALAAYTSGLPAYVLIKVFQPAYFAREDMVSPFRFSLAMVAANIIGSIVLFPSFGHVGIALATSISAWLNVLLLAGRLYKRRQFTPSEQTWRRLALILLASLAMGFAVWGAKELFAEQIFSADYIDRLLSTGLIVVGGSLLYLAIIAATGAIDPALWSRARAKVLRR
jgi:putative peptidoglycan lipid II flippase